MSKILIADDDAAILELLTATFEAAGFDVVPATDGDAALTAASKNSFDALLLDLMMPHLSGIDVTRKLRKAGNTVPIMILTARDDDEMREVGLERGVDSYLDKSMPLNKIAETLSELIGKPHQEVESSERSKTLVIDTSKKAVWLDAHEIEVTKREFEILEYLSDHADQIVTRDDLLQKFWGVSEDEAYTRTMDVLISRLRKKLDGRYITTKRGFGYVFSKNTKG